MGEKSLVEFSCSNLSTILCIWDGEFVMMYYEFYRLTNSCAVCFIDVNIITAIVVDDRSEVPTLKTFGAKREPFVLINHSARARRDDVCTVKVELTREGMIGG